MSCSCLLSTSAQARATLRGDQRHFIHGTLYPNRLSFFTKLIFAASYVFVGFDAERTVSQFTAGPCWAERRTVVIVVGAQVDHSAATARLCATSDRRPLSPYDLAEDRVRVTLTVPKSLTHRGRPGMPCKATCGLATSISAARGDGQYRGAEEPGSAKWVSGKPARPVRSSP